MSDPFVGEIRMFGGNFAPRNWALCDGQLLAISQNDALFSLLGTIYGGDGRTTFALPDLRGRAPIHSGNGPGLSDRRLGAKVGVEQVTVTANEYPAHRHEMRASGAAGTSANPGGNYPAAVALVPRYQNVPGGSPAAGSMNAGTVEPAAGGGGAHPNVQPFQCVTFIIALFGVYPSRN